MYRKILSASFFILCCATHLAFSQQKIYPGGVEDPLFWIRSRNEGDAYYWESLTKAKGKIPAEKQKGTRLNFNPGIDFDNANDSLILPLGVESQRRHTVFLAYKLQDSLREQFLWTINDPERPIAVATNKRLVDVKRYSYRSYQEKFEPRKANIHFYQQSVTDSLAKLSTLLIGQTSTPKDFPAGALTGTISEILVYNRVLSGKEIQKVASYLGIKYGISLSQYEIKNYLNSSGNVIWDIDKHKGFSHSITGVGRDDGSGLLQHKSSNMFEEGLLTIELQSNTNEVPNNYFAFWSDNGKGLLLKKQDQGEPLGISREWHLDFTNPGDLRLGWTFNPAFIQGSFPEDTYYWLLVDYSGKGTYEDKDSQYVRLASTRSKEKLLLADFNWDKQKTGTARFTLKVAPEMFSTVNITEATCGVPGSGQLQYAIEGGEAPFTVTVKESESDRVIKEWHQAARSETGVALSSGTYDYVVTDKRGNQYTETIFVADKDGTVPNVPSEYVLTDGNALLLDASKDLPLGDYEYEWFYEGNFIDNRATIRIDEPGDYELRLTNGQECKTSKKISVTSDGKEIINSSALMLYPNPTPDGKFSVEVQFPRKTNASIRMYSPAGVLIKEEHYSQVEACVYEDTIKGVSGMYLVKVNSEFGTKVFKVVLK